MTYHEQRGTEKLIAFMCRIQQQAAARGLTQEKLDRILEEPVTETYGTK